MIISIEGIDGVGKTTVCKILSDSLGYKYLDMDKQLTIPRRDAQGHVPDINRGDWRISAYAIDLFSLSDTDVVLDRGTLSSWAYEQRNEPDLDYLAQVCEEQKDDLIIVLLVGDENVCFQRDSGVAERGWTVDDLTVQQNRMINAAHMLRLRGVKVLCIRDVDDIQVVYSIREFLGDKND